MRAQSQKHWSGFARTVGPALHLTVQLAGKERRYILPVREFNQFVIHRVPVTGVDRDEFNKGNGEKWTVRFNWEDGNAVIQDTGNDPSGENRLIMHDDEVWKLFSCQIPLGLCFGGKTIRLSARADSEAAAAFTKEF